MRTEAEDILLYNAFNGLGDITGDDDYGISIAWLDTWDCLETGDGRQSDTEALTALLRQAGYGRYLLVFLDSNGILDTDEYATKAQLMDMYRQHETQYLAWMEEDEDNV